MLCKAAPIGAIALVTWVVAWVVGLTAPFQALEWRSIDWRFLFRGPQGERSDAIALVLIEEEADLDYRSPIPRRHLAHIIEKLAPARLIGLDILLDRPSFDARGDTLLRQALAERGNVVAVSYLEGGREHFPHPFFEEVLLDVGYATLPAGTEEDFVRQCTLTSPVEEGVAHSFATVLHAHYGNTLPDALKGRESAPVLINYSGPSSSVYRRLDRALPGGFAVCPSHLLVSGIYPPAFFKDKVVLVGTGLEDAWDRFRTPFFSAAYGYEKMLGVEVHAHILQMLLSGDFLQPWKGWWIGALALGLELVCLVSVFYRGMAWSVGILIGLGAGLWGAGFWAFGAENLVVPLIVPSLSMVMAWGLGTAWHALVEGREKRRVRQLFEKYLSADLIEEFLDDPSCWELGGKTMEITVLFADLEGFTPLAEKLAPEQLVHLVNQYLTEMSALILDHQGTIDKYEGDLVMALFGAPVPRKDHAARACRAALAMQQRMEELRLLWSQQGLPSLRVRIGLHSGPAVVGNMGSEYRFNYTAMGDTVNLASRLEGANKQFGTGILVSEATCQQARADGLSFRGLGEVQVKGKSVPVAVYELVPEDR